MLNKKALAASVSAPPAEYVEDVFSTYLYTGTGSTQTITNGIDLSSEGGLVWTKDRTTNADPSSYGWHSLIDTERGGTQELTSNDVLQSFNIGSSRGLTFDSDGYDVAGDTFHKNISAHNYVSWSFRKAPKFFDIVTYTGTGSARTIAHNLGSTPGMIILKCTSLGDQGWRVYHRSLTSASYYLALQSTAGEASASTIWNATAPTSTVFSVGTSDSVNKSGETYVAYLFAHDAGGFGEDGTDNIISCGSFTTDGSGNATVNLGYEPQYVLTKSTDAAGNSGQWIIGDSMRQMSQTNFEYLVAESSGAAGLLGVPFVVPTATGFNITNFTGSTTYIYMAIRRPMKTPTTGTEVFAADIGSSSGNITFDAGFPVDLIMYKARTATGELPVWDRLRGGTYLSTNDTDAESANDTNAKFDRQTSWVYTSAINFSDYIGWLFKRAPGFFDIVCYTGTGSASSQTITHNLGVAPELMIVKSRGDAFDWLVYSSITGNNKILNLSTTAAAASNTAWNNTTPTSTGFTVFGSTINSGGGTHVAYLFATLTGISKVGSYTGNGSNQTINCGFTGGARFILIKRTDSTGNWCIFDTTRGIVSGNDPFSQPNRNAADITGEDVIDPDNSGFIVNQTTENLNVNNATYVFLAIA